MVVNYYLSRKKDNKKLSGARQQSLKEAAKIG